MGPLVVGTGKLGKWPVPMRVLVVVDPFHPLVPIPLQDVRRVLKLLDAECAPDERSVHGAVALLVLRPSNVLLAMLDPADTVTVLKSVLVDGGTEVLSKPPAMLEVPEIRSG
jgi:hypothetical protein